MTKWNKERIVTLLETNDKAVARALVRMKQLRKHTDRHLCRSITEGICKMKNFFENAFTKNFFENAFTGVFIGLITGAFLLLFGFGLMISNERDYYWQKQAIERDYGEFCSRTGEWAWIGECEQ